MSPRFGRGEPRPDDTLLAATVDVLAGTLGLRDGSTGDHSDRVVELAQRIGERLGLERRELRDLGYAARLHDIGKVGVPDAVLFKAGPLEDDEREVVEHHAVAGATLIGEIPGLEAVARIVRHHHECYDGNGYPDGLSGRDIPLVVPDPVGGGCLRRDDGGPPLSSRPPALRGGPGVQGLLRVAVRPVCGGGAAGGRGGLLGRSLHDDPAP